MHSPGEVDRVAAVGALQPEAVAGGLHDLRPRRRRRSWRRRRLRRCDTRLRLAGGVLCLLRLDLRPLGFALRLAQLLPGRAELPLEALQLTLELADML